MGFKLDNFGTEVANAKGTLGGICYYRYRNSEGDDLTTPGYFPALLGLNVGDRIYVIPQDASNADDLYVVTSIANRTVKAEKVSSGGGSAVIDELNVTPSTSAQTITPGEGVDGFAPVNVSAVDATIDANIVAGNIKDGVEILGVTGNYTGAAPAGLYREFQLEGGTLVPNKTTTHIMDFTGMTEIYDCLLFMTYAGNTAISGVVDMSDLITIYGDMVCGAMFQGCTGITSANLSALTDITGQGSCDNMFAECTGLTSFDLSALTTISGDGSCGAMFQSCTGITSANLPALTVITGSGACDSMFYRCTGITSANLSALTDISGDNACQAMFQGCTSLATVYIGGTTGITFDSEPFNNMFQDCFQDTIDVYAPAANQTEIESFSGYPNFGATGNVVWHWRS